MQSNYCLKIYPKAQIDIENIFKYIHDDLFNHQAAYNLLDDFLCSFKSLCSFPEKYPKVSNKYVKDNTIRKMLVKNYIVFYRVQGLEIQIIRVIYGMRDYENLL